MLATNQYIKQWKQWINRDKKYAPDELEELETFLLDKIEDLQETQKLSDKEVFLQALDIMGEQGMLTEEFSKVRRSKFDKVKLWAYVQTFVCLLLVVFIAIPYLHIPRKNPSDFLMGDRVGTIDGWIKEQRDFSINNVVSYPNHIYLSHGKDIFHLEQSGYINKDNKHHDYRFLGTYFSSSQNFSSSDDGTFHPVYDIDQDNKLYCWSDRQIKVYDNAKLIENIPLLDINRDNQNRFFPDNIDRVNGVKVLNGYLFVFFTSEKKTPTEFDSYTYKGVKSHYFICDLSQKEKKFEKISLDFIISGIDRSEDEIAILSMKGDVSIYNLQNKKLVLNKSWKIITAPQYFSGGYFSIIFTKNNHQMVIGELGFLYPINENELKIIPLLNQNIVGIIKLSQYRGERLLMIRQDADSKIYGWNGLYTFKQ